MAKQKPTEETTEDTIVVDNVLSEALDSIYEAAAANADASAKAAFLAVEAMGKDPTACGELAALSMRFADATEGLTKSAALLLEDRSVSASE